MTKSTGMKRGKDNVKTPGSLSILVTREKGRSMAEKISARGGRALLFPTIETGCILGREERDSLLEKLKISTWVIFTSQKAVTCFVEILGENIGEYLEAKYVAAVGGKTRDALNRLGVNCQLVGR